MEKLKFINQQMAAIGVPYEFGKWSSAEQYPYSVGEFTEFAVETEDGYEETELLLTIFHRGSYIDLENIKNNIKKHFPAVGGLCAQTGSGSIAAFFDGSFYVPTNEADLKKLQINLKIKEWKGAV